MLMDVDHQTVREALPENQNHNYENPVRILVTHRPLKFPHFGL